MWEKQPDGAWRVVLDAGIPHVPPDDAPSETVRTAVVAGVEALKRLYAEAARVNLLLVEKKLAAVSADRGSRIAFDAVAADSVRVYRPGQPPQVGKAALREVLEAQAGVLSWVPVGGGVARSGLLGYTYGLATFKTAADSAAATSSFVRLWQRDPDPDSGWRLLLDLAVPLPPDEN